MEDKNYRLSKITNELMELNSNIARLVLYLGQNEIEDKDCLSLLDEQLNAMEEYRDALKKRIAKWYY